MVIPFKHTAAVYVALSPAKGAWWPSLAAHCVPSGSTKLAVRPALPHPTTLLAAPRRRPQDPCPPPPKQKVGAIPPPDSKGPLLKLARPMLFINGEFDAMCPGADLRAVAREMGDVDMRVVVLPVRLFCGRWEGGRQGGL